MAAGGMQREPSLRDPNERRRAWLDKVRVADLLDEDAPLGVSERHDVARAGVVPTSGPPGLAGPR
jgi:hypothetical protein